MTGTALTDAEEFEKIYELGVTPLPTNVEYIIDTGQMGLETKREKEDGAEKIVYVKPQTQEPVYFKRVDYADQVYGTGPAKDQAIINEIKRVHATGRPILVGTTSVEHSETIAKLLNREGIRHNVLNAKIHQSEALVVAQAGRRHAVTISTNMAGRGTDILLGGNPEGLAAESLENEMFDRPMLTQLAFKLLTEGEEAARDVARKSNRLTEDLVDALIETRARFAAAMSEIDQVQVVGYLARVLQEPYGIDYNDLLNTLRLVRAGELAAARSFVESLDKDVALVDEILRRQTELIRWQNIHADDKQVASQFLAEQLFERHYNARAALIRAVLGDRPEEARQLVATIPGLGPQHIARIEELREQSRRDKQDIWQLGGLHVVGSERHESRRIDNQLRGRAARQGDPGSSRFFLSLEDDLMKRFGGERLKGFMSRTNIPEDMPIENGMLDKIIESSQERVEGYNFDMRKNVVEYDDVMSMQRQAIYNERRAILMGEEVDLDAKVDSAFDDAIVALIDHYIEDYPAFIRGEVERVVEDFTTDATNTVNVAAVVRRLAADAAADGRDRPRRTGAAVAGAADVAPRRPGPRAGAAGHQPAATVPGHGPLPAPGAAGAQSGLAGDAQGRPGADPRAAARRVHRPGAVALQRVPGRDDRRRRPRADLDGGRGGDQPRLQWLQPRWPVGQEHGRAPAPLPYPHR
jgi:preprotein translocase subunit SecA